MNAEIVKFPGNRQPRVTRSELAAVLILPVIRSEPEVVVSSYEEFVTALLADLAASYGIPYDQLTADWDYLGA